MDELTNRQKAWALTHARHAYSNYEEGDLVPPAFSDLGFVCWLETGGCGLSDINGEAITDAVLLAYAALLRDHGPPRPTTPRQWDWIRNYARANPKASTEEMCEAFVAETGRSVSWRFGFQCAVARQWGSAPMVAT
jgi:hypothetical protein